MNIAYFTNHSVVDRANVRNGHNYGVQAGDFICHIKICMEQLLTNNSIRSMAWVIWYDGVLMYTGLKEVLEYQGDLIYIRNQLYFQRDTLLNSLLMVSAKFFKFDLNQVL